MEKGIRKNETAVLDFSYRDTLFSMGNKRIFRKKEGDRIIEKIKEILGLKMETKGAGDETEEESKGDAYKEALRKARKVLDKLK